MKAKEISSANEGIKIVIERSTKAISLKPTLGPGNGTSKTKIIKGHHCEIIEGAGFYYSLRRSKRSR